MNENNSSGANAPEVLIFDKDKAGQRIYEVKTAKLPDNVTIMSLDKLVALAAEYGTPHFRAGGMHYAYLPYHTVAVAREDGTVTKPAGAFILDITPIYQYLAGVKAAPSIEVRA